MPTITPVIPQPITGRDASWRQFELEPPLYEARSRYYLEERIGNHKMVAEVYADCRRLVVRLHHAVNWDHQPGIRWFIAEQIDEVRANGR